MTSRVSRSGCASPGMIVRLSGMKSSRLFRRSENNGASRSTAKAAATNAGDSSLRCSSASIQFEAAKPCVGVNHANSASPTAEVLCVPKTSSVLI